MITPVRAQLTEPVPLDLALQEYLLDGQARGLRPKTLRLYRDNLTRFIAHVKACSERSESAHPERSEHAQETASAITPAHIRSYLAELARSHTPGGVYHVYRSLKSFCRWCYREGLWETNPIDKVRPPRLDQDILAPLDVRVLEALLATCDKSVVGLRDRAILLVLLDSGLRAGELLALNVGDVDWNDGAILVVRSKSRRPRVTFIGRRARRAVWAYLRARGHPGPEAPLWLTVCSEGEGERLTYWGLRSMLVRRSKQAGVKAPSLHSFRRAFALLSLRAGADPVSLSRMLGHGSLPVILRYLRQERGDLAQVHAQSSPVDRLLR